MNRQVQGSSTTSAPGRRTAEYSRTEPLGIDTLVNVRPDARGRVELGARAGNGRASGGLPAVGQERVGVAPSRPLGLDRGFDTACGKRLVVLQATEAATHLWRKQFYELNDLLEMLWSEPWMLPRRVWHVVRRAVRGYRIVRMYRADLRNLPPPVVPQGYKLQPYKPGLEAAWLRIVNESFGPIWTEQRFVRKVLRSGKLIDGALVFLTCDDHPVATACASQDPCADVNFARLRLVGVLPGHRGKGLGRCAVLAALRAAKEQGYSAARLETDTSRDAAIRLYLGLGFVFDRRFR